MADARRDDAREQAAADWRRALGPLRPIWAVLHDATDGLFRHDGLMVASAVSYSLIFALFPFAVFLVALGATFGGTELASYIRHESLGVLPHDIVGTLEPELNRIFARANRASPLTFGLLVTLISVTGAVESIRGGLNRAYGCAEDRHAIRRYLSSALFVVMAMAFLLVVSALGVAVPIWIGVIERYFPGHPIDLGWLESGRKPILVLVTAAMLLAMHMFLPARRPRVLSVLAGVVLTLFAWWLAGKAFGLYITEIANYSATYAGLAGIIVLMFFLYIQALIFLYGAELNRSIGDLLGTPGGACRQPAEE